jgi:acylpyruvate hydrolase
VRPPASAQRLDYEAEIAVVVADGGRNIPPEAARFWAVAPWNDFSIRDPHLGIGHLDRGKLNWALQKTFQTGSACGPWLTVEPDLPVDDIEFSLTLNGQTRQEGSTQSMIYSFALIAAHLSEYVVLRPGDIITSGTPAGTAVEAAPGSRFLEDGDEVSVRAGRLGTLTNVIDRST